MTAPSFEQAVVEASRRAMLRIVRDAMRKFEEYEMDPAARWELLRKAIERFGEPPPQEKPVD